MENSQVKVNLTDKGISLAGNLIFSTVSDVLQQGSTHLENHQANEISINLSEVNKIDSSGIALLLGWKRLCDSQNKSYAIEAAQDQATSLITTNKMHQVLNLQ